MTETAQFDLAWCTSSIVSSVQSCSELLAKGLADVATGLIRTIQNPTTHSRIERNELEGPERLAAYSYLARMLDDCRPARSRPPDVGAFIRSLLPVTLTGGYTVTFGVWVAVRSHDLQRAFEIWWQPGYASLKLNGLLANKVAPWEVFCAPVSVAVLNTDETPYCVDSADAELHRVLTSDWDHENVLRALPS